MADTVKRVSYYYAMVQDKPGEGLKLLGAIKQAGVDLFAYSGFPSKDGKAQLVLVPKDGKALEAAAKKASIPLTGPKTAFLIQGDDRVGAVADTMEKLGKEKVNITALDAVCAGGGRYAAVLWVKGPDVDKTAKALGAT